MRSKQHLLFFVLVLSLVNGLAESRSAAFVSQRVAAGSALSVTLKTTLARTGKRDLIAIVLNPDATFLAAETWERKTELWNTQTGQLIATLDGRTFLPYSYSVFRLITPFSPDGRMLVTIGGTQAKLWDSATGRLKHLLRGSDDLSCAVFSPDGKTVATGNKYGTVTLWDTETGQSRLTFRAYSTNKYPRWRIVSRTFQFSINVDLAFSPDGKRVLTVLHEQPAKLWDATSGRLESVLGQQLDSAEFSPSGRYVITKNLEGTDLWDTESGKKKAHFTSWDAEFSPDEHWLGLVEYEGIKGLLNLETMKVDVPLRFLENDFSSWTAFSPNGEIFVLASGLNHHSAGLVDVTTGRVIADIPIVAKQGFDLISDYLKYTEDLSFHPSSLVLMGANHRLVRFWNTKTGNQITEIPEARSPASFSSDGKLLITAGQDKKSILLWDVKI